MSGVLSVLSVFSFSSDIFGLPFIYERTLPQRRRPVLGDPCARGPSRNFGSIFSVRPMGVILCKWGPRGLVTKGTRGFLRIFWRDGRAAYALV